MRTRATYLIAHKYGALSLGHVATFDPRFHHATWHADLRREVERAREAFVEHFARTYDGFPDLPVWMASEVMSFGTLSKMFGGLRKEDQRGVVKEWLVEPLVAVSWLHALTYVRNVCAHQGRLWNRQLAIKPVTPRHDVRWKGLGNSKVFAVLCLLRQVMRTDPGADHWARRVVELLSTFQGQPRWLDAMGVPVDYRNHAFWRGL